MYSKFDQDSIISYYHLQTTKETIAVFVFIPGDGTDCYTSNYYNMGKKLVENGIVCYFLKLDLDEDYYNNENKLANNFNALFKHIKQNNGNKSVFLAGHSSAALKIINYATWEERIECDGYIFVSPYLGKKVLLNNLSSLKNHNDRPSFALNFLTKGLICGNVESLENTPKQEIKETISDQKENANINRKSFKRIKAKFHRINKPIGIFIGSKDELFNPAKVVKFFNFINGNVKPVSHAEIIPELNHISIINEIDTFIIWFIKKRLTTAST